MGLIFFGNERLANSVEESGIILQSLIDNNYDVTHLVVNQNEQRGRKKRQDMNIEIANNNGIEVITDWNNAQLVELAQKSDAGVLASFGRIIRKDVIDAFPRGIVNIHPSLLPIYRGPTPIESAILGNDSETGVSLMALTPDLDAGNIYDATKLKLIGNESKQYLYDNLAKLGAELLVNNLPTILSGENSGEAQDHEKATFTKLIIKSDGDIDWDQSASTIEREVRAFLGWPGSRITLAGYDITLTKVRISTGQGTPGEYSQINKEIEIACGEGSIIVERLKPAGKSEMTSQAFLAGNQL